MQTTTALAALLPRLGLLAALSFSATAVQAQVAAPTWASVQRITSGSGANDLNIGRKVVVAADGSQIVSGVFIGSVTLGGTTLTAGPGDTHYYLAKYNPNGTLAWALKADENSGDSDAALAVDAAGNVYMAGFFGGSISFGTQTLSSAQNTTESFVVKFSPQGTLLWSKTAGVTNGDAYVGGVAVDAAGNVYVSGDFDGSLDFGGGATMQLSANNNDIFLYKFTSAGAPLWGRRAGSTSNDINFDLAADAAGNTYLTGTIRGSANFGSVVLNGSGATGGDIYAAKFDTQGNAVWAQRTGTPGEDNGITIAVDAAGTVVVGGYVNGISTSPSNFESTAYLARFNAQGTPLWTRQITPSVAGGYSVDGLAYDGRGGIYAITTFQGTLSLGGSTFSATEDQGLVVRYDGQGNAVWASSPTPASATDQVIFFDVSTDATGNAHLAGAALGSATLGPVTLSGTGIDGFVAKLNAGGIITSARAREAQLALAAFPNPASGRATLQLPAGGGQLSIVDALGRTVREQALPAVAGRSEVSLAGLAPGVYQLRATLGNGQTAATRLTVR
jgi:hypothetical protein